LLMLPSCPAMFTFINVFFSSTLTAASTSSQICEIDGIILTARPPVPLVNTPAPPAAPPPGSSIADELRKLADLRAEGLLTDAEFATQKARLLGMQRPEMDPGQPVWSGRHGQGRDLIKLTLGLHISCRG
jgi:hypothetical protein